MNVTVETLGPCKKLLKVEVDIPAVDKVLDEVTAEYRREANFPGFRPGKAPREMVVRRFVKEIEDEAKKRLISKGYKDAIASQNLDVVGYPDVEEIQFGRGKPLQFAATIETSPEFELPEYKGIPVQLESRAVTEQDIASALEKLQEHQTNFQTVERPVQTGDIAVVNFTGTCEGKPITDIAPTAKGLTEQKGFWVESGANSFIPGFSDQLLGAKAGDKRTVTVDFPADFVTPQLAGKKGVYEVEVVQVKEKLLPVIDEEFAKKYGAESLEKLREGVRRDLQNELDYKQKRVARTQIIRSLLNRVNFDLPEGAVARETRNVVYDIVQDNTKRGVPPDVLERQKEAIYSAATQGAQERVKVAFLIQKIAEKEDIKVSQEEMAARITTLAAMYQIPAQKFAEDLQKRNGMIEIFDQVMNEKVLDLLYQHAKIEEVPPGQAPAAG